jgi:hypothetical protein
MDLYYENIKLARVAVTGMTGSSGIGFFRLMVNLEFTFTSGGDDAILFPLTGRLLVNNRDVGRLFPVVADFTKATPHDYPETKMLYADLDRPRVEALEAIRNGGALNVDVHVAGRSCRSSTAFALYGMRVKNTCSTNPTGSKSCARWATPRRCSSKSR